MHLPPADLLRDLSHAFNYAEVAIWPVIGLVLLIASFWRAGAIRRDFRLAAVVLFAFGPTDLVEAAYGDKWWEPWWLLVWKVACVVALAAILFNAWKRERRRKDAVANASV
ncbi:hypothetical protein [Humisphaera borealis]|uniref:Uncharacterized protein n=1 Tax=Humisphaera borealis TaxID=2807512 RepID=A0A7M2X2I3_9BACT|nr:hypothetical protein [Humisphaera borealis]QOV91632.1 hypothetical protein IPV69_09820 [Humisphaera borealis]